MRVHIPRAVLGAVVALATVTLTQASPHRDHRNHRDSGHRGADGLTLLAAGVAESARRVHVEAERTAHHPSRSEELALSRLHDLDLRARDFDRALRYDGPYAPNVRREYRELQRAFHEACGILPRLHAIRPVEREFARLQSRMSDLNVVYGDRLARYDDRRPHRDAHGSIHVDLRWPGGRASVGYRD